MLKSIDFWPLVPKKLSVESSINDDVHQKSIFTELTSNVGHNIMEQCAEK